MFGLVPETCKISYNISVKKLTTASIKKAFPKALNRHYDKGQIICYDGDKPQYVFFVAKGHIRYYDIDDEGNEKILHVIGPDNLFPMLFAFEVTKEVRGFYASLEPVDVVAVPLKDFTDMRTTDAEFANDLTYWFLTEINQLVYRIASLQKTDAHDKVLYALSYLARTYGHTAGSWQRLDFPVTQQFIADLTGLARETVSTTMHELEQGGLIKVRKAHELNLKTSVLQQHG